MSPPYRDINNKPLYYTEPVLTEIAEAKILAENGIIIAQHHIKETFTIPQTLEVFREEKYGDTLVHFLRTKC